MLNNWCKVAEFQRVRQNSVQWFHRSVQPLHAILVGWKSRANIASQTGRKAHFHFYDMSKRVRISNDSLNSYGTRVLTSGMNVEQYCRNPVLLYQHERGQVIGYVKDLQVENDEVTGELMFDCASELSKRCKKQYEFGSLRMVSVGIDILELSDDKQHLVQGQTSPTITKSKLFEVSLVDIGANDDAIVLQKDGKRITLGKDGECPLPLLNNNNNFQNPEQMDQKKLALSLGLPETADEAAINAAIEELKTAKAENADLKKNNNTLTLERITNAVDKAIGEAIGCRQEGPVCRARQEGRY